MKDGRSSKAVCRSDLRIAIGRESEFPPTVRRSFDLRCVTRRGKWILVFRRVPGTVHGVWRSAPLGRASHDFDCVRLSDRGVLESSRVLSEGPDEILETLDRHGLYLACITSHCNLLDEREEERKAEQSRLIRAIESAALLGCPVVVTGSGSPVMKRAVLRYVFVSAGERERPVGRIGRAIRGDVRAGSHSRGG